MQRGQRPGAESGTHPSARLVLSFCLLAVAVAALAFGGIGAGGATTSDGQFAHNQSGDDTPPTIVNGTRVDDTTVRLTISDNHDVDESTITASQFVPEKGSFTNASVTENGTNATVTLTLDEPVNQDELFVAALGDTSISDTNGNFLGDGNSDRSVAITNMDGVTPKIFSFRVTPATGEAATLEIEASEPLSAFNISVSGADDGYLTKDDFETSNADRTYRTTYTPAADGELRFSLFTYTDEAGNTRTIRFTRRVTADLTPPDPQAGIDLSASSNLSMVFDGSQSTDANGIANYSWNFGDGETANGSRVRHIFSPGSYTVTLEVTDIYGNAATDTIPLNLSTGSGNVTDVDESILAERRPTTVSVQRSSAGVGESALVTVDRARAGEEVRIPTAGANASELVRYRNISLAGLTVTTATNRSFDLALSMSGPGTVSDAAVDNDTVPLAGFTLVHAVPDGDLTNATLSVALNRSALAARSVTPENVSIARASGDSWQTLPTTVRNDTVTNESETDATATNATANGTVVVTADSPGFSRFAVRGTTSATGDLNDAGSDADDTPAVTISDARLNESNVTVGDSIAVAVTVRNNGTAAGTLTAAVSVNDTVVTSGVSPSIEPGANATFDISHEPTRAGTFPVAVNETSAGTLTVRAASSSDGEQSAPPSESDQSTATNSDDEQTTTPPAKAQFNVTNVTLNRTELNTGEPVTINATVENRGESPGSYTAGLAVNGAVVATTDSSPMPANETRTVTFQYAFNRTGEFSLSVNGTTGGTVTVGSGGGGLLAPVTGVLSSLPIPVGLLQPLLMFVVAPLVVLYLVLKGLAVYLGY